MENSKGLCYDSSIARKVAKSGFVTPFKFLNRQKKALCPFTGYTSNGANCK